MSDVVPLHGPWVLDQRGPERGVRVTAHADAGVLVLSTWKGGTCSGTVRLRPAEAAQLVAHLTRGLADLAGNPGVGAALPQRRSGA